MSTTENKNLKNSLVTGFKSASAPVLSLNKGSDNPPRNTSADLIILPELRDLLPPLTQDENELLTSMIKTEGVKMPLIVWPQENGNMILVDGHNRNRISEELGMPRPRMTAQHFKDLEEVKAWMIKNQSARRSLTELQKSYFIGMLFRDKKDNATYGDDVAGDIGSQKSVSRRSVYNNFKIFESLQKLDEPLRLQVLHHKIEISKTQLKQLSESRRTSIKTIKDLDKEFKKFEKEKQVKNEFELMVTQMVKTKGKVKPAFTIEEFIESAEQFYSDMISE